LATTARHLSRSLVLGAAAMLLALPIHAAAQERRTETTDSLRAELARLTALVDSLRQEVARLQRAGEEEQAEDALAQLRAAAQAAAAAGRPSAEPPEEQEFVGRQRSLQALNPEISLTGDVFGSLDPDDPGADAFLAREFEVSIQSNLDPFSRAKVFLSRHAEGSEIVPFGDHAHEGEGDGDGHHGGGFAVEEGYVEWVSLPGGLGVKLGRFFQQFGQLNRWHSHALGFQSRSLPHIALIGEESLAQAGASVRWLLPVGGRAGAYTATLEATRSSQEHLFGHSSELSWLSNLNAFWQLSEATDLDLSLSWVNGGYTDEAGTVSVDRNLFGAEMSFTWSPPAASRYRGFNLRAGAMVLDGLLPHVEEPGGVPQPQPSDRAMGFWSAAELRLSQSWLVGGRLDWTENPEEVEETAWLFSPTLAWWQSEYVRIRAEYDLLGLHELDNEGRLHIQVTFSMGPHKHEIY
jgi:hypothetical protein